MIKLQLQPELNLSMHLSNLNSMTYKNTPDIAIVVENPQMTVDFFKNVLGFKCEPLDDTTFKVYTEGYNLYITQGEEFSITLEFLVEDVETEKKKLLENDCELYRWNNRDHWMKHSSGFMFNLDGHV